jgi:hypothetical protein
MIKALLESLLLDETGSPLVNFTKKGHAVPHDASLPDSRSAVQPSTTQTPPITAENASDDSILADVGDGRCSHTCERRARAQEAGIFPSWSSVVRVEDLLQTLPSPQILIRVVDYYCVSLHHWMPYLHKARCQDAVRKTEIDPDFLPILHALVAVVLPRMSTAAQYPDHDEMHRQVGRSRHLALQYSMSHANLQSLQALLLLVFEQVRR